jgi:chemotaxis protein methyltransferase CheR
VRLSAEARRSAEALIAGRLGLSFSGSREADLEHRLLEAVRSSQARSVDDYLAWLAAQPDEGPGWARLASLLTIGETYFFRDRACFQALEETVLPALVADRRARGALRLRLWSAGCATGEEPYSLAILLDRLLPDRARWQLTILGTDLNPDALDAARRGVYREWSLRSLPDALRARYFVRRGTGRFELDPCVRSMVALTTANLTDELPPLVADHPIDLILCRNALMYLTEDALATAVGRLQGALARGGWLVVAPAEASAQRFRPLVPVNFPGAIFFRKGQATKAGAAAALALPVRAPEPRDAVVRAARSAAPVPPLPPAPERETEERASAAQPLLEQARALADRGELPEALRLCKAALEERRLDPEVHRLLAAIHQERGDVPAALAALRRALYLDPDSVELHLALGNLLLQCGQRRRGLRHLEAAQRLAARAEAS